MWLLRLHIRSHETSTNTPTEAKLQEVAPEDSAKNPGSQSLQFSPAIAAKRPVPRIKWLRALLLGTPSLRHHQEHRGVL